MLGALYGFGKLSFYYLMGIIAGVLWFAQFLVYEQGHARMGNFGFISWGIHMAMLVFFSFGVGLIFREWHNCSRIKPSPAILAEDEWCEKRARADIRRVLNIGGEAGMEFIMKDISTVRYDPRRLWEWARVGMGGVECR